MNTTTLMHTNQLMAIIDQERDNQLNEMFTAQNMHTNKYTDHPKQIDVPQYVQTEQFDGPPPPYTAAGESVSDSNECHTRICSLTRLFSPSNRILTTTNIIQRQSQMTNYCKIFNKLPKCLLNNHH